MIGRGSGCIPRRVDTWRWLGQGPCPVLPESTSERRREIWQLVFQAAIGRGAHAFSVQPDVSFSVGQPTSDPEATLMPYIKSLRPKWSRRLRPHAWELDDRQDPGCKGKATASSAYGCGQVSTGVSAATYEAERWRSSWARQSGTVFARDWRHCSQNPL